MPIADPTEKRALSKAIANTYAAVGDVSPWELCQQYQQMLTYTAEHPEAGRVAVARAIGENVPTSRVRVWLNGGMPDAMHGIQACEEQGWLDLTWDGPTLHNFAIVVAWIFSGGSISDRWMPYLTVDDDTRTVACDVFRALGDRPKTVRNDDSDRATEVRPTVARAPLGRLLTVLGAPHGSKASGTPLSLPPWLADAPRSVRLAFVRTYVTNRGTPRADRPNTPLQINENRSAAYRRELTALFDDVAGGDVTHGDSRNIRLTAAGAELFDQVPTVRQSTTHN